jgi:carboxypeptidase C (cathepsin A)
MRAQPLFIALAAALVLTAPAAAQQGGPPPAAPPVIDRVGEPRLSSADVPAPRQFVTHHHTVIRGRPLAYTATAGETYITNLANEPIARFFAFSYVKDGPTDPNRPVTFVFNGGPGSSSLWLHLGVIGPRRVVLDREVNPSNTPPFGLRDNPYSPLDVTDLVFIDPVGTGFSQAVGHAKDADFFSVDADAESVARFIEQWLNQHGRWNAPKYLIGESYGSVRAALLPRALMGGVFYGGVMRGITVNGVVLLGVTLNMGSRVAPPDGKPDPTVGLALPSYAVTAWYHNRIDRRGRSAAQVFAEARTFATGAYAEAVFKQKAGTLTEAEKAAVAQAMAGFTGIPAASWIKADLKLSNPAFLKQLLADQGLEAGAYDSRYTLPLAGSGGDPVADDPAMGRYTPGFIAAFNDMLHDDLKVDMPAPYKAIVWEKLNFKWDYTRSGALAGQSFATDLAVAMRRTPALRVLVASGYYDMVTPAASAESQVRLGGLPAERTTVKNYESGHMLYLGDTAESFANDVRTLILGSGHPAATTPPAKRHR